MQNAPRNSKQHRLITKLKDLWKDEQDHILLADMIQALDTRYDLIGKMTKERGVEAIVQQMLGRLANSFGRLSSIRGKRILDIACGSNSSKAPAALHIDTPFGQVVLRQARKGYTAQFEPWFCRILLEFGADPVGIDFGDLQRELFPHYRVDLGELGALDFLPAHSFDAVQDSRLFGSPEFISRFPNPQDRLKIAHEIKRQEQRLLKAHGIIIHSDAATLLSS